MIPLIDVLANAAHNIQQVCTLVNSFITPDADTEYPTGLIARQAVWSLAQHSKVVLSYTLFRDGGTVVTITDTSLAVNVDPPVPEHVNEKYAKVWAELHRRHEFAITAFANVMLDIKRQEVLEMNEFDDCEEEWTVRQQIEGFIANATDDNDSSLAEAVGNKMLELLATEGQ